MTDTSSILWLKAKRHKGSISFMKVIMLKLERLTDLGGQDAACVSLPCEDPPPSPGTSGESRILEKKIDLIEETQLEEWTTISRGSEPVKTTAPDAPSPDSHTDLRNPNMSDLGSDAPLTKSWIEEEADGVGDLRT